MGSQIGLKLGIYNHSGIKPRWINGLLRKGSDLKGRGLQLNSFTSSGVNMHSVSFLNVSVVPANTSGDANSYLKIMIVVISVIILEIIKSHLIAGI